MTVTGSVAVTNLDGADEVRLGAGNLSAFTISGNFKLLNGRGGSQVFVNPAVAGTIAGAFCVCAAAGDDELDLNRMIVDGNTLISVGGGDDAVEINDSTFAALTINTGADADVIRMESNSNNGIGTIVNGALKVNLDSGNDLLLLGGDANDAVTTHQAVTFNGGQGLDKLDQSVGANIFAIAPLIVGIEVELP